MDPRQRLSQNPLHSREDFAELLKAFLDPLLPFFSEGSSLVRIGGTGAHFDQFAAEFEGFARPLWGLAPLLAGGGKYEGLHRWQTGLMNGSNPSHPDFWGPPVDGDQRFVEMAAVGVALALSPDHFWTLLSAEEQRHLISWLSEINTHFLHPNNWRFFRVLVNVGLRAVGAPYSEQAIKDELDHIETFYDSSGWPSDGPRGKSFQIDYYASSFAVPFYSLIYAKVANDFDPVRCELFRERTRKMALDVVHLFAPDGAAIPFGRSLTYRFAVSAFWAAAAYADVELPAPLSWGVVKGLLFRNIRWFLKRPDIFASDGTLSIGYGYSNLIMAEAYNSPQSPYWCLKSFLPLAIPASHPFWTAAEEPYPPELLGVTRVVRPAYQVLTNAAGHTFMLTSGQSCPNGHHRHGAEKYGKFAYSSTFGFSVPTGTKFISQHGLDSMLGLCDDDIGEKWSVRGEASNVSIGDDGVIASDWQPWVDVSVRTWLVPPQNGTSAYHVRVHRIQTARHLKLAEGAFALRDEQDRAAYFRRLPRLSSLPPASDWDLRPESGLFEVSGQALAVSSDGVVGIRDLQGPQGEIVPYSRTGVVQHSDPNSNVIVPRTVIPMLVADIEPADKFYWLASAVFALPFHTKTGSESQNWLALWENAPDFPDVVKQHVQLK